MNFTVDLSHIKADYIWYDSEDGTKVPLTLLRNTKTFPSLEEKPEKPVPTILYVYGGFGVNNEPFFEADRLIWLEHFHGMVAFTHIRGGGELGNGWYEQSRMLNRSVGISDLIAGAEFLQSKGWTDRKHMSLEGGSNGGFMTAATVNKRPDLFGCVFSKVPVTDMLRFHHFTIGNSWVSEYGFSEDPAQIDTILTYSPLHNIKKT